MNDAEILDLLNLPERTDGEILDLVQLLLEKSKTSV
jgi:hypothetical protein